MSVPEPRFHIVTSTTRTTYCAGCRDIILEKDTGNVYVANDNGAGNHCNVGTTNISYSDCAESTSVPSYLEETEEGPDRIDELLALTREIAVRMTMDKEEADAYMEAKRKVEAVEAKKADPFGWVR